MKKNHVALVLIALVLVALVWFVSVDTGRMLRVGILHPTSVDNVTVQGFRD